VTSFGVTAFEQTLELFAGHAVGCARWECHVLSPCSHP
jgi:hypothetical protein